MLKEVSGESLSEGFALFISKRWHDMIKALIVLIIIAIMSTEMAYGANYMYEKASVKGVGYISKENNGWTVDGGWFIRQGDLIANGSRKILEFIKREDFGFIRQGDLIANGSPGQATYNGSCRDGPLYLAFTPKILRERLNVAINVNDSNGYIISFVNNTNGTLSTYLIKYNFNNVTQSINGQRIDYDSEINHQMEIGNDAGRIRVYIHEIRSIRRTTSEFELPELGIIRAPEPVIDYNDSSPLTSGRIAFLNPNGSVSWISNISIYCPSCWDEGVPNLGPISFKRPNKTDLVNTTWGWVPANQVMVVVNETVENSTIIAEQLARMLNGNVTGSFSYLNLFQIETNSNTSQMLYDNLNFSKSDKSIRLAFPNEQVYDESEKSPIDNYIYKNYGGGYEVVGVQDAWDIVQRAIQIAGFSLNKVYVGVADDGLYTGYGEFSGKNVSINASGPNDTLQHTLESFSNEGSHGTGVMNLIAADPGNGGLVGIASQPLGKKLNVTMVNIFPDGNAYATDCFEGLAILITSGCRIISCSWGDSNANEDTILAFDNFFRSIEKDHNGSRYLFVCSAGNEGDNGPIDGYHRIPNGHPNGILTNMITVGNIYNNMTKVPSSNYQKVDDNNEFDVTLAAPGEQSVWGYNNESGNYTYGGGGTSMAVPYVTAAAALIRAVDRALTAEEIKSILIETGIDLPDLLELGGKILAIDRSVEKAIKDPNRCVDCQEDSKIPKVPDFEKISESIGKETNLPTPLEEVFGNVTGRVYDDKTDVGVANAEMVVDSNATGIRTDALGNYRLKVKPGTRCIGVRASGYGVHIKRCVRVDRGQTYKPLDLGIPKGA
jgi:hypothetical protein